MAIQLKKLPIGTLNVQTGQTTGIKGKQPPPTIGQLPIEQLHAEVIPLAQKGVPIEKVLKAVQNDARITDKAKAADIVQAVYGILSSSKKPKTKV